ncbi:MAG: tetratricopeptide repeat protein, partial [Nostoc sp. C3-bin3]|nr:tetratricopeptide repeat protein [Nostoc sp. C3-bin3]
PTATASKAGEFLVQGVDKYKKGDLQGAIADYNQAIKINPNDALASSRRKPWETIISSTLVASIYIAQLI